MTLFRTAAFAAVSFALSAAAVRAGAFSGLHAEHPWARPIPPGAPTGAGYLTLVNDGDRSVRLVGGTSPATRTVEVHEMTMTGGVMRMRPVPGGLPVPAHGRVELKPGAFHLMLIGPSHAYRPGERIPVTLRFNGAPPLAVSLAVEGAAPSAGMAGMGGR